MLSRRTSTAAIIPLAALLLPHLAAQFPARTPTPNDKLKSVEVLPDNKVTLRIYAPKASDVKIVGDWMPQGGAPGAFLLGAAMEKDDQGVWSITVGPLTPDFYSYSFRVDGVRIVDPKNALVKQGVSSVDSMFELPGAEAEFEALRSVPHGEVREVWYQSSTLDMLRRMHVYTPPGYDSSREKYPVFYLLHGGGDEDSGWSTIGRAGFILDNLLAAKKAKPMIVVMPNGSLPPSGPSLGLRGMPAQDRFVDEMLNDVIPFVEKNFRTLPGRDNRALAGLSMGGAQTISTAFRNPGEFAYLGIWSSGFNPDFNADLIKLTPSFWEADKTNKLVKLIWIGVGKDDPLANKNSHNLTELLSEHGIHNEFHESAGGHTWINWRHYLDEYAQLLFR